MLNHKLYNEIDIKLYVDILHSTAELKDAGLTFYLWKPQCDLVELTPTLFGSDDTGKFAYFHIAGSEINEIGSYDLRVQSDKSTEVVDLFNGSQTCESAGALVTKTLTLGNAVKPHVVAPRYARLSKYLWVADVRTPQAPNSQPDWAPFGCTSFTNTSDGANSGLFCRNFDFAISDAAEVYVKTPTYQGMAYIPGFTAADTLTDTLANQAPFYLVDGINNLGLRVSTHLVANDAAVPNDPNGFDTTRLLHALMTLGCDGLQTSPEGILGRIFGFCSNIKTLHIPDSLYDAGYSVQWAVSLGRNQYLIRVTPQGLEFTMDTPSAKLTNFDPTRELLPSDHPQGLERYDAIDTATWVSLSSLKYTNAYKSTAWLSEFIGLDGTTYADYTGHTGRLEAIQSKAAGIYATNPRDGRLWQTMHSVSYTQQGLNSLYVQEDITKNYAPVINAF